MITKEVAHPGRAYERDQGPTRGILGHEPGRVRKKPTWKAITGNLGKRLPRSRHDGAVLGIALALLLDSLIGPAASLLLFTGVVAAYAWSGGARSALVVATLAALTVNHFLPPHPLQGLTGPIALALSVAYVLDGVLVSMLVSALRGSRDRVGMDGPGGRQRRVSSSRSSERYRLLMESSRQSKDRFLMLVDGVKDYAIFMLEPDGRVASWSPGAERITGYTAEEILGRHSTHLYSCEAIEGGEPGHEIAAAVAEGRYEGEGWRLRKDGSRLWAHFGISALRDEAGDLRGFAVVLRDHTEKRRAEEALRRANDDLESRVRERTAELARVNEALQVEIVERTRAEEALRKQSNLLRLILDNMPSAVVVVNEDEHLLLSNPAAERMFRFDLRDASHPRWWRQSEFALDEPVGITSPLSADALPLTRAVRGEELNDVEFFLRHPTDAGGIWISINGCPLRDGNGDPCGGLIVCRDITDRKRVAEALKNAKELAEAASRSKDQFLAILSHELRTPLTPVLLTVSAMLDKTPIAADFRQSLEMIRRNIELEARLIDDLLDVARASCGRMSLDFKVVDAHDVIHEALTVCGSEIHAAEIRLILDLAAAEHHVNADPARLQQVFWNFIKNAVKFTPQGGWLAIRTRNEEGSPNGSGGSRLIIEVADSGIGIEPDVLPRIFDPFEQGSVTLRRRYGGLGLGLAISRSVIDAHGGRLTASSEGKDRGSTILLELMTVSPPAPAAAALPPALDGNPQPQALRILLVEDNKETLRCLTALLGCFHAVRPAAMLSSALEFATTEEFDLVLSDIELPDGTGLELMHELRKTHSTPGIAMSGFGSEDDIRLSRSAGFAEHLIKPIDIRSLENVIQRVAGHAS
jgi:PAS domain S-box-containing protein